MSGNVVGNLTVRLDFDGSQFERGMAQAKRELSTYNRAVGMSTKIAKDNNYEMGKSSNALNNMQVAYQGNAKMVAELNEQNDKLRKNNSDTGQIEKNINAIRNHEMSMYELEQQYKQFQQEMITANSSFTKFGDGAMAAGNVMVNVGDGISRIGSGLTKAGLAVGATFGVFTKQAIDFEQGLAGVQKTTNASSAEMEVLEKNIRDMAKEMPIATGELLALGEQAGQLGIPQARIAEFTETMVMMGTSTNLSAQEAGESFARFVNVTGHGLDDLDKLGSAVVHLGNNFATTESEIMNLAMGLAGSLSTVGVSEANILGLSAGMSALGINAERGSSSMSKFFINMAQDVSTGKGNLESFARVSGVSMKEFQRAFEEDAMGAMEMFITGLGELDESGGDLIGMLEEMDIKEIRLRDTILRLAGGHEVLSDALQKSNEGYEEGSALQEEYDVLAQTTASQVEIAKNKIKDLGISMGQALLPAIIDIIDNSEGLIQSLEKGVDWFVNLDDSVKETLVRFTAFALVGGPILNMFGNLVSGGGNLLKGIGQMSRGIGKLEGKIGSRLLPSLFDATSATGDFADGAVVAGGSKGVGALVHGVSIGLPVLKLLVGAGGLLALGYAGFKLWGEGAMEAKERTQKWGENVDDETDKVLTNFQNLSADVEEANAKMATSAEEGGQQAIESYGGMVAGISETIDAQTQEIEGFYAGLSTGAKNVLGETTQEQIDGLNAVKESAEQIYGEINEIYAGAIEEDRRLTDAEMDRVETLHRRLAKLQAEASEVSQEQIRQTQNALMNDLAAMSEKQLLERQKYLREDLDLLKENYNEQIEMIDELQAKGRYSEEEANAAKIAERQKHHREIQEIMDEEIKLMEHRDITEEALLNELMSKYSEYGFNRMDIEARVQEVLRSTQDETAELDLMWRNLLVDPVTGEVITNLPEVLADMHQSDEDWAQLNYMIKEARLDSNTLETIDEALIFADVWDDLDPEVKELLSENRVFMHKLAESEEALDRWNGLPDEDKLILGDNHDLALAIMNSEEMYNNWMNLPEEDKLLLGNNADLLAKVLSSEKEYNRWLNLKEVEKKLLADNSQLMTAVDNAQRKINSLKGKKVTLSTIHESVYTSVNRAGSSGSSNRFAQSGGHLKYGNEKGTNFHAGGLAMVNDERSNRFRELVTLPDGRQFIPDGKNVMLDLPRGSKVLRASLTKRLFPDLKQYADGVGLQTTRVPKSFANQSNTNTDLSGVQQQINQLARALTRQQPQQVQTQGVTIHIGTIENNTKHDIPKILEEASWIMQGEGRRLYEG